MNLDGGAPTLAPLIGTHLVNMSYRGEALTLAPLTET